MAKSKGKTKKKGKGKGKDTISKEGCKNEVPKIILVETFTRSSGTEFYHIDLVTGKVTILLVEYIGKESVYSSMVTIGSYIYLIGSDETCREPTYDYVIDKENESGFTHDGISYVHYITSPSSSSSVSEEAAVEVAKEKWNAGRRPISKPTPDIWCPRCQVLDGKIYVFTFTYIHPCTKPQVYDPALNQWTILSPPPGRKFRILEPVLADHSNNRLLFFFQTSPSTPIVIYAYYPNLTPRWVFLVPHFTHHLFSYPRLDRLFTVESGVIFFFDPQQSINRVFTAYDVDSKQTLNLTFPYNNSNVDERLWNFKSFFTHLINLGNGFLCLVVAIDFWEKNNSPTDGLDRSINTHVFAIQFKIHRTSSTRVLVTPFPGKYYPLGNSVHLLSCSAV